MTKWTSTGDYGLRYREHQSRTTGVGKRKRPVRYYAAVYKWKGKTVTDVYGWEGDDFKNYDSIVQTALSLRQNRRGKIPPFTLRELLNQREEQLQKIEAEEQAHKEADEAQKKLIMDNVFDEYCDAKYDKKSLKDEKGYYKNWIKSDLGPKRLDEIGLLDLDRIKKKMTDAGKAPRSILYIKSIIRQIYNFAAQRKIYSGESPTTDFFKRKKLNNKRQRYLSQNEAQQLLDEIKRKSVKTYRISLLSLNTGMRFGEIASLQWGHVKTQERLIEIMDPKNLENRLGHMNDTIATMFSEMTRGEKYELVFSDSRGKRMERVSNTFAKSVNKLKLNEGITDRRNKVVFHTLRHSCASWLVNSGVGLPVIARILGHKSLTMTNRYAHINDTSVKSAVQMLDTQQGLTMNVNEGTSNG